MNGLDFTLLKGEITYRKVEDFNKKHFEFTHFLHKLCKYIDFYTKISIIYKEK
ncbi:hypothetical protein LCGC14_1897250 [marine sediment metagenome]|uniref:Uncharacterized protein n=1 Tax=marine sediment metagenome TaxID=412755 RepID=A0A0F9GL00_9ZZZZ